MFKNICNQVLTCDAANQGPDSLTPSFDIGDKGVVVTPDFKEGSEPFSLAWVNIIEEEAIFPVITVPPLVERLGVDGRVHKSDSSRFSDTGFSKDPDVVESLSIRRTPNSIRMYSSDGRIVGNEYLRVNGVKIAIAGILQRESPSINFLTSAGV